ncbi:MAG: hypothetical protein ACI934_000298 [Pseudohongiellaceae bacterium]|jgi:hypothetical protein
MKLPHTIKILTFIASCLFAQLVLAADNEGSADEIARIVSSMNHFPSDADKMTLMAIAHDESLAQGVRDMAATVANIQHFPNHEGKAMMASLVAGEDTPERGKVLAGIIGKFAHMVSAEDKARLMAMF